jgi:carboxyl-terminal processing protease
MNVFSRYLSIFIIILTFGSFTLLRPGASPKDKVLQEVIMGVLKSNHFRVQPTDDAFSEKVFDIYIRRLDPTKRFLVQEDVDRLQKYRHLIDDQINGGTFEFYKLSEELINARMLEAETYYKDILSRPFDFYTDEETNLDYEKLPFARDREALKESWRKYLKYQVLIRLTEQQDIQEKGIKAKDTSVHARAFEALEEDARQKVRKSHDEFFARLKKLDNNDRFAAYLNAITSIFDPHTNYFPPRDKENFDIAFSGRLEGIGATLQEKDGYIKVSSIVPGSPSYRQGELKANDIILKVAQGKAEPVDIVGMPLDEAVQLIRGKKGTEVRLTVKKLDGKIIVIPIKRDVVIIDETYAKTAIIKSDKKSIGYVKLPSFYADFNNAGGPSSYEDVKREIRKLGSENVSGIILDLRNNGGGSLQDVVDIAGLFIESGPVVQVKSREGQPYILEDKDPAVPYDGPLVILVNSFSASASEILAAAMQDYKRAVIMGSTSSFGKGSVQRFIELDDVLDKNYSDVKPLGALKVTTQKFYRINGGATQLKGVIPDIILPDNYSYFENGEKDQDYPMEWDEIPAVPYKAAKSFDNLDKVVRSSRSRIDANPTFRLIDENAKWLKQQSEQYVVSLKLDKYKEEQFRDEQEAKKYEKLQSDISGMEIVSLRADQSEAGSDISKAERTKEWHKTLKQDQYIFEAVNVLKDLM